MNPQKVKDIIEAVLLSAEQPLNFDKLLSLFSGDEDVERDDIKVALDELQEDCRSRGIELKNVSSGFRFQVKQELADWVGRLKEDKPPRYSRALLETLSLIAYRQPITRAGVEDVRGVSVSSSIIRTLLEREWIRVIGHRDVPGKPALYGTTRQFLDYFNLKSLTDLPPLAELRSIDKIQKEFDLNFTGQQELDADRGVGDLEVGSADGEMVSGEVFGEAEIAGADAEVDFNDGETIAAEVEMADEEVVPSDESRDENLLSASTA